MKKIHFSFFLILFLYNIGFCANVTDTRPADNRAESNFRINAISSGWTNFNPSIRPTQIYGNPFVYSFAKEERFIPITVAGDGPCETYTVYIWSGGWGDETTWALKGNSGATLLSGGTYSLGYSDTKSVTTTDVPVTLYIETVGTFNDNAGSWQLSCCGSILDAGGFSGGGYYNSSTVSCCSGVTAICKNITRNISASDSTSITASMIDDGSSTCNSISLSASKTTFNCSDIGTNFVTLTVSDGSGGTSTCVASVNIVDDLYPVAVCKNITVYLDSTGTAVVNGLMIDDGSTDNCTITSWLASPAVFTVADLGTNSVVLTVTDFSSNSSTCMATVTVMDTLVTSMNTTVNAWNVNLFPNPNSGKFSVLLSGANGEDCRIEMWSVDGRKIFEQSQGHISGSRNIEMNISNQAKGIYFVKVWMGETQVVKKMVVQ